MHFVFQENFQITGASYITAGLIENYIWKMTFKQCSNGPLEQPKMTQNKFLSLQCNTNQ